MVGCRRNEWPDVTRTGVRVRPEYALVLLIIYNSSLKDKLIFKGGTAIHHIYLDQLRFSEDLNFSSVEFIDIQDLEEAFHS